MKLTSPQSPPGTDAEVCNKLVQFENSAPPIIHCLAKTMTNEQRSAKRQCVARYCPATCTAQWLSRLEDRDSRVDEGRQLVATKLEAITKGVPVLPSTLVALLPPQEVAGTEIYTYNSRVSCHLQYYPQQSLGSLRVRFLPIGEGRSKKDSKTTTQYTSTNGVVIPVLQEHLDSLSPVGLAVRARPSSADSSITVAGTGPLQELSLNAQDSNLQELLQGREAEWRWRLAQQHAATVAAKQEILHREQQHAAQLDAASRALQEVPGSSAKAEEVLSASQQAIKDIMEAALEAAAARDRPRFEEQEARLKVAFSHHARLAISCCKLSPARLHA